MQVDAEDRYLEEPRSAGLPIIPLVLALLALAIIGYWYFSASDAVEPATPAADLAPVVPAAPIAPVAPEPAPTPDIPEPVTVVVAQLPEPNEATPPPEPKLALEASDPVVKEQLAGVFTSEVLRAALETDNLIERGTSLVDAASQGLALHKLFPLPAPQEKFAVTAQGEDLYVDPQSYQRYDSYAQAISSLDPQSLADSFHKFRPLLEEAYTALGYKAQDLDNALIRALDQIASAPVLGHPAVLEKQITTYKYADESLEELSPLVKQILRMGPENQALVQQQAVAIRKALLSPQARPETP